MEETKEKKKGDPQEEVSADTQKEEKKHEEYGSREMHKAVCAECGKNCEVPFEPTEGKPVFCRECFMKRRRKY